MKKSPSPVAEEVKEKLPNNFNPSYSFDTLNWIASNCLKHEISNGQNVVNDANLFKRDFLMNSSPVSDSFSPQLLLKRKSSDSCSSPCSISQDLK